MRECAEVCGCARAQRLIFFNGRTPGDRILMRYRAVSGTMRTSGVLINLLFVFALSAGARADI